MSDSPFAFAKESSVQLLTVASAILALTITFFEKFALKPSIIDKFVLSFAWGFLFLSVFFGIATLLAITGSLEEIEESHKDIEYGFKISDLLDPRALLSKLQNADDAISSYLWSHFSEEGKKQ